MSLKAQFETHEVSNQPLPLPACNVWSSDAPLREAVERNGGAWASEHLAAHGALAGGELVELGELANRHKPVLHGFDRYGRRTDHVEFHPAYHEIMRRAMRGQVHSFSWRHPERAGAHVVRAALMYLNSQPEAGTGCPLTMTHAAIPALRHAPAIAEDWIPRLLASEYDPRTLPAEQKTACTIGMGMTEKQGGSDVRQNSTRAHLQPDGSYELVGHKFFFSAPMCDAHLVLAQADGGLSCFLLPRVLPDGTLNAVRIQRLKDKLGDWSNASSEVEFLGATAHRVGAEGRGVATILEMVALTRLDCLLGSAAGMRQALVQALHHVRQRSAFGHLLVDQPLMRNVLADLALESEAAVALAMRVARAVDASPRDPQEAAFARVATAIGKYWVCKRTPAFVNEAQECLGGIGYVEENILPRLYRQAPLNSIWEGSGNVQCLDVLRAFHREPETRDALLAELQRARGAHALYDAQLGWLARALGDAGSLQARTRLVVERVALLLQASLLLRHGDAAIADSFCRARLGEDRGSVYGTLDAQAPLSVLIERAMPML
ncbi:isovaleryl-CoA dehydrogenase [Stenotrophomonas sp. Betaine-02u-21]|uniref:isovaleryl-CoA dehydrogenase n=1 Tax=unclassified Stenotrophomonas TaxID=196198 RepID=UPI000C331032|nr:MULTISPECIES: isovaleryl-CoA dehydrogenase [unclassified Stenotrophomonas]PKH70234.1 isovaleryl-CoA dehydrogenase [Stenotrophomonas sp. Betaine-02u-23]PKH73785.1 isovaleryl-CoA dehydrogenase [Stenotrophomonas sp. Betaine-02u-21]PKH97658.1 isovaleryl-CoA dehydrogenase [Stenotrophomonas sp. Bg11-02]